MRIIPSLLGMIKDEAIFSKTIQKGPFMVTAELVKKIKEDNM